MIYSSTCVFPTLVGVFLADSRYRIAGSCLPHARGGVSDFRIDLSRGPSSSPRSWGCFLLEHRHHQTASVFPTLVGVFLPEQVQLLNPRSLPHARGGVSAACPPIRSRLPSSPRSWGCFRQSCVSCFSTGVFPTLVGVFPRLLGMRKAAARLPHARGGVSISPPSGELSPGSSPRSWGCFPATKETHHLLPVFPTLVGVFPDESHVLGNERRLPHARGGVSILLTFTKLNASSSPRPWGCFHGRVRMAHDLCVFPTLVGVFPMSTKKSSRRTGLPHARGGVPHCWANGDFVALSSPRSWGCFLRQPLRPRMRYVFPTLVGVFLTSTKKILPPTFFLRIRGDGCQKDPPGMGLPMTAGCIRLKAVPSFLGARR